MGQGWGMMGHVSVACNSNPMGWLLIVESVQAAGALPPSLFLTRGLLSHRLSILLSLSKSASLSLSLLLSLTLSLVVLAATPHGALRKPELLSLKS